MHHAPHPPAQKQQPGLSPSHQRPRLRCAVCKQLVSNARILDGKPYCPIHAFERMGTRQA